MRNIVLIGMPSSGKSTIGRDVAKKLGMNFLDTDLFIIQKEKKLPREIVNNYGLQRFLDIQESIIFGINVSDSVISTGGSVVYSDKAMLHFKKSSDILFLDTDIEDLESRISPDRRFARSTNQSFRDIYEERQPLYKKYADLIINCTNRKVDDIAAEIVDRWRKT